MAASVDVGLGRFTPQEPERASRWELDDPIPMNGDPYFFENSLDFLDAPGVAPYSYWTLSHPCQAAFSSASSRLT